MISGNSGDGVAIESIATTEDGGGDEVEEEEEIGPLDDQTADDNAVLGNLIGATLNEGGYASFGNGRDGVRIVASGSGTSANFNTIGGLATLVGGGGNSTVIAYRNGGSGNSSLSGGAGNDSLIGGGGNGILGGGPTPGSSFSGANVIGFNAGNGVTIISDQPDAAQDNPIQGNSIFENAGLAIDLGGDGPTPNDSHQTTDGPNQWQDFPVLNSANFVADDSGDGGGTVTFAGTLTGAPSTSYQIDFLEDIAPDGADTRASGNLVGSSSVKTLKDGVATFTLSYPVSGPGTFGASATDPNGNTSEFSQGLGAPATYDLATSLTAAIATGTVGQDLIYTVSVANLGAGDSGPFSLAFTLPTGAEFVSASSGGVAIQPIDGRVALSANDFPATPETLVVTVRPTATGPLVATAEVLDSAGDTHPSNNSASLTTPVVAAPVAALTIRGSVPAGGSTATAGQSIVYSFIVTNPGTATAGGVVLTVNLPGNVAFDFGDAGATASGGVVTLDLGAIGPGGSSTATVTVTASSSGPAVADAVAASADAPSANTSVSATVLATPSAMPPTPSASPATAAPAAVPATLMGLTRTGFHMHPTTLILQFSGPIDAAEATDLANYRVVGAGPNGKFGARDDPSFAIRWAVYDPIRHTVSLRTRRGLNVHHVYKILVGGATPGGIHGLVGLASDGVSTPGHMSLRFGRTSLRLSDGKAPFPLKHR